MGAFGNVAGAAGIVGTGTVILPVPVLIVRLPDHARLSPGVLKCLPLRRILRRERNRAARCHRDHLPSRRRNAAPAGLPAAGARPKF